MQPLLSAVDAIADEQGFSGVVSVDRAGEPEFTKAYGLADRARQIPNTVDTRFALASGAKTLTALAVASLIEQGVLQRDTTARSVLGDDLPLIDDRVTVEQLLAHRSGIGDYMDEDADLDFDDYLLTVPAHALTTTEDYLAILGGFPTKFPPGEQFSYCNGGYVVLALIAERASGVSYYDLMRDRVCTPAGMTDTEFLRSDELPDRTALGYLGVGNGLRTNIFHLPVRGVGDGGVYSTVADVSALWRALYAGRIVSKELVAELTHRHSDIPGEPMHYGLGFWVNPAGGIGMVGGDSGISFQSIHQPDADLTYSVISNTADGAWPVASFLRKQLSG